MTIDAGLLELFTDEITITPATGTDLYGRPTYGTARTAKAFIEREPRLVQSREGREIVSSATVYVDDVSIGADDKLTYTDGTNAEIVSISIPRDETGPAHSEVSVT